MIDPGSAVGPAGQRAMARPPARTADQYDTLSCAVRPALSRGRDVSAVISFGVTVPAAELELVGALRIVESAGCRGFAGGWTSPFALLCESSPDDALASERALHATEPIIPIRKTADERNRISAHSQKWRMGGLLSRWLGR